MAPIARRSLTSLMLVIFAPLPQRGIERVAWLQGCWEMRAQNRVIEEHWTAPRGRSMLGVGRVLRGDSLVEYEFVVLREQGGVLVYEAHPSGQQGATFTQLDINDSSVVFENRTHDFPQRVGYRRAPGDSLVAWIEGTMKGATRRIDFAYVRAACPSH